MSGRASGLRIWSATQAYVVVAAVVAGILFVGIGFPLVFGHAPKVPTSLGSSPEQDLDLTPLPTATARKGVAPGAPGAVLPTVGPVATVGAPPLGAPGSGGGAGGTGTGGGAARLTASDRGVTATTIKLGVVLLDLSSLTPLGLGLDNYEVATQRRTMDTYIAQVNSGTGLFGRKVVPVYATLDPLDSSGANSAQAICVRMVKDEKVFAITGWAGDAAVCAAVQHQTPGVLNLSAPGENYTKSNHYLSGGLQTFERLMKDWAGWLTDTGVVRGKKLGMVAGDVPPERTAADVLEATLRSLGSTITYRARLTQEGQIPIEVQKMRAAGVDTVLLPTNFVVALQFVQHADSQNWKPQYLASDFGTLSANGLVKNMGPGFDGAIAITGAVSEPPVWQPESAVNRACRLTYNKANPGKDFAYGEQSPLYPACFMMTVVGKALNGAGPTLTRAGFVQAVQRLGRMELPSFGWGSFGPGKTDFADEVRPLRWSYSCRCYRAAGAPTQVRY